MAPPATSAFALVLWEQVAYLASDERRTHAFAALRREVGVTPERILRAGLPTLTRIAAVGGIHAEKRVRHMVESATIVRDELGGDLDEWCRRPASEALAALRRFPMIGRPGAEKILMLRGVLDVLALDSNALRVLLRLGFGREEKSYDRTYRSAQSDARVGGGVAATRAASLLLRHHGQETCKSSRPRCEECVVSDLCRYASAVREPPAR